MLSRKLHPFCLLTLKYISEMFLLDIKIKFFMTLNRFLRCISVGKTSRLFNFNIKPFEVKILYKYRNFEIQIRFA